MRLARSYEEFILAVRIPPHSLKSGRVNLNPPMSRVLSYLLSILIWISVVCVMASRAQSGVSSPIVILEATSTMHGIGGYENKLLLVRLTDDGKVEWDKLVGSQVSERETSSVSAEVVSNIERALKNVDESLFRGKMGPYYVYVDTSIELQVRMTASSGQVTFLVTNPWSPGIVRKPMPNDVKTVVCEISRLHAQVANTPVNQMCKASNTSR